MGFFPDHLDFMHTDWEKKEFPERCEVERCAALGNAYQVGTVACLLSLAAEESDRSEEHTSELQSLVNLVCRLLLEKKKTIKE